VIDRTSRLLEMPSPFPLEPGTVRLVEPPAGFDNEQLDRLRAGTLGRPFIIDSGRVRNLFFTTTAVQSAMWLDDPHALVVPYTRKMMAFLLYRPMPRHVLMIGLGGGSLAKFCYRRLPRTRITVVEVSAEVIALRDEFAIPRDDARFEIIREDGAAFLSKTRISPDVILIDAFDDVGVSPSLASSEFYESASQCMTPDGVLVMNLSGIKSRYAAPIRSVQAAFAGPVRLVPVDGEDNVLLFAFGRQQPAVLPDRLRQRARYFERRLGLEFSRYLGRLQSDEVVG
jgi:spermidine synthase